MLADILYTNRVCVTVLPGFFLFLMSTPFPAAQGTAELMGTGPDRTSQYGTNSRQCRADESALRWVLGRHEVHRINRKER
jgi:hypothetical protein